MYRTLKQVNWPEIENEISALWGKENTFQKSIEIRPSERRFVFYEGPPSANGMPGIHHVMSRAIKDIFCRYKTLQGFRVDRKGGWDTHGLPIELQVEKRLGITKEDIGKKISVEQYNLECRQDVMMFKDKWDDLTQKMGYWVDLDHPYITYENKYIETLWHLLKRLHEKGFLYKGYTIQPYSPAAGTGLSSHELNQPGTYRNVKDTTAVAQFSLNADSNSKTNELFGTQGLDIKFLAWTTTPWTLPSNTALAVGKNINYVLVKTYNAYSHKEVNVVLAENLIGKHFNAAASEIAFEDYKPGDKLIPFKVLGTVKGASLEGLNYEQLLSFEANKRELIEGDAFKVIIGDFVTTEDGTGIVHIAPSFGADDFRVAKQNGIGSLTMVDKRGKFVSGVEDGVFIYNEEFVKEDYLNEQQKAEALDEQRQKLSGFIKDTSKLHYLSVDERLALKLQNEDKLFKKEKYEHTYPHCWRTDKPILYYPLESWFIRTTAVKDKLVEMNKTIKWKPESTGEGRFGNWLENLVDWNLSRSRFWGTPLPIWKTDDGSEEKCIGSKKELFECIREANEKLGLDQKFDEETFDLHKPFVDQVILVSSEGKPMKRESDLIDVWFDSGAMPYAQWGLDAQDKWAENFPADFIAEGVDQTRGWFFTLHAIAVMLFDSVAYKNVLANGLVLDKNGTKMSKRLGNVVDPFATIAQYGADSTRWYMITNSDPWDNLKFDLEGIAETQRKFFGTLYNTYSFFAIYANIDQFEYSDTATNKDSLSELDHWILSKLNTLIKTVSEKMDDYDPTPAARAIETFVCDDLSNWYVRLSRRRFWKGEMNEDKHAAYDTLYKCLGTVSQLMSPYAPFFSDWLFRALKMDKTTESVHLSLMPKVNEDIIDVELEKTMGLAQDLSSMVLGLRKKHSIRVRQPLRKIMVPVLDEAFRARLNHIRNLILSEVNVKELEYLEADNDILVKGIKPNFKALGPKIGANMKALTAAVGQMDQSQIRTLESTGKINLNLGQTEFELLLSDVEITSKDIPGWLVNSYGGLTVALDITIDEELRKEGIAREFVNRLQNLRKESGLDVTDRIVVEVQASESTLSALLDYKLYICSEILADALKATSNLPDAVEIDIEGEICKIKLDKNG
ncbi:MAG TPA: isoleucine--tRNA ligase [Bacteroidia bacterium]